MNSSKKRVCILYRTNSILPADEPEMNRQRTVCLSFARQKGWLPIREFWEKVDDETGPAKNDDALVELRAGAEQGRFDILLVTAVNLRQNRFSSDMKSFVPRRIM